MQIRVQLRQEGASLPGGLRRHSLMLTLAYLDPGSGSMIVQAVVGGVAAAAVMAKFYWRRLLGFLGIRKKDDQR